MAQSLTTAFVNFSFLINKTMATHVRKWPEVRTGPRVSVERAAKLTVCNILRELLTVDKSKLLKWRKDGYDTMIVRSFNMDDTVSTNAYGPEHNREWLVRSLLKDKRLVWDLLRAYYFTLGASLFIEKHGQQLDIKVRLNI